MKRHAWWMTAAVIVITLVLEIVFRHLAHGEFPWHEVPGFDFVYGLGGSLAIVLVSKWMGQALLQRRESYYDDEDGPS